MKHGVAAVRGRGQVEVDARADGNRLRIEVADNGPGLSDARPSSQVNDSGYGLKNIRERLRGYFEDRAELVLRRDEGRQMTLAGIVMPLTTDTPGPSAAGSRTGRKCRNGTMIRAVLVDDEEPARDRLRGLAR